MKWRFSCYVCGHAHDLEHKSIHKDAFYGMKKVGRPILGCPECDAEVVGDMIGERK